ncbi:carbohydrate porin [Labilibacter sediminis]|nr:carbohydrate porin [Labilibacter sediminis]
MNLHISIPHTDWHLKIFILTFCFFPITTMSQDKKPSLLDIEFNVIADVVNIHQGSQDVHNGKTLFLGLEQLGVSINPFREVGNRTLLHFNILNAHGAMPSENYIGDLQIASNIEAGNYIGLFEAYLEQTYNNHSIRIGQLDLNGAFLYTDPALYFSNSSFGIMPSVSCNVGCSIYPISALGFIYRYSHKSITLQIGLYDGDPGSVEDNNFNLQPSLSEKQGLLSITEAQYNFVGKLNGSVKLGSFFHSANFLPFEDSENIYRSNYGGYILYEQSLGLTKLKSSKYNFFIKGGFAPSDRNFISSFAGVGIVVNSLLNIFDEDQLGIAFAQAYISKALRNMQPVYDNSETSIELFYGFTFLKHFSIQPSIQYIVNPGALKTNSDALISLFRFQASL